ncbi:hypothetical protein CDQ84_18140 [Clostridium thermosuccinogenes]|uniref:Uncharacterized protein n=1 Tax=Clostridium thermosuccinogenes TaxID=84032 RepID=A0A2K2F7Y9_9CLOT|nr:hypothetical protein [Pseudoclostridium thermosuccinogenes]AUS97294.1 hypothetical protein CDO33_13130 [Pseudoclostridium thermosuccinogenes]PNT91993.1 hypothetical protein CDQ85_18100 [Pseudoclostridium thermosuccinogenes]PNT94890.1 hypothetical protein CDQ84_18140 [Pseudoclostridium thermosuccinogenes]
MGIIYRLQNSKKWINLLLSDLNYEEKTWVEKELIDINQWLKICKNTGFVDNYCTKICGEFLAPHIDKFPFENEIAQWMAEYVFTSRKP